MTQELLKYNFKNMILSYSQNEFINLKFLKLLKNTLQYVIFFDSMKEISNYQLPIILIFLLNLLLYLKLCLRNYLLMKKLKINILLPIGVNIKKWRYNNLPKNL